MKYHVELKKGKYCVYDEKNESEGEFATRREAIAKIRELMKKPNEDAAEKKKSGKKADDEGEHEYR